MAQKQSSRQVSYLYTLSNIISMLASFFSIHYGSEPENKLAEGQKDHSLSWVRTKLDLGKGLLLLATNIGILM